MVDKRMMILALLSRKSVSKMDSTKQSCLTINALTDPNSKLLMDAAGRKPVNPFPDERAFEDSLVMNFHPGTFFAFFLLGFSNILCVVPGHQGRFAASHAMTCIGTIIDYQNNRRYVLSLRPFLATLLTIRPIFGTDDGHGFPVCQTQANPMTMSICF